MRLKDKVILVTGSATGIGEAIAKRIVSEGGLVVVHGLEENFVAHVSESLNEYAGNCRGEQSVVAVGLVEDLTVQGCPERLVRLAVDSFGRLDGLVNNAAVVTTGDISTTDYETLSHTLAVNTVAPLLLIQAGLQYLRESKGCVLNIGSVNAYCGESNLLPYSISKGALMTLTRNLGDTLFRDEGVRVNQINPGWVLTHNEIIRKRNHGLADGWSRHLPREFCPAGRLLTPDEIAAASVYWLGDESGPVSGQVVDLEQHPFIGRNPTKNIENVPAPPAS